MRALKVLFRAEEAQGHDLLLFFIFFSRHLYDRIIICHPEFFNSGAAPVDIGVYRRDK
jgi:hypothetical protein